MYIYGYDYIQNLAMSTINIIIYTIHAVRLFGFLYKIFVCVTSESLYPKTK